MTTQPTLTEQLKQLLPENLRDAEPLRRVAELEQAASRGELEREFLERAPREGLLHAADALRLEDIHAALANGPDRAAALTEYFNRLRANRPFLFTQANSPGAQKIADNAPEADRLRKHITHGALTRQLQAVRIKRR
jgi:hypothetical protein